MSTFDHVSTMNVDSKVWVRIKKCTLIWLRGIVIEYDQGTGEIATFTIKIEDDYENLRGTTISTESKLVDGSLEEYESVKLRNLQDDDDEAEVDDLTDLHNLHEPAILNCLRSRYDRDKIYSATGPILISVNPFKKLPIYDSQHVHNYRSVGQSSHLSNSISPIEPHIFRIADAAYRKMIAGFHTGDSNQSILVSGESGSGKTEATKYIMRYLADITALKSQGHKGEELDDIGIEKQVLQSNPILESFGNARTVRNDNSSRFGKFVEINFVVNRNGLGYRIKGAITRTYLLEKVRIVHQCDGERNYHCFYELLAGASESERCRLALTSPSDFHYTNQSDATYRSRGCSVDEDASRFKEAKESMDALLFTEDEQEKVRDVLAAVLHLGNLEFSLKEGIGEEEDGSQLDDQSSSSAHHLSHCARLLGVSGDDILSVLCEKSILTPEGTLLKRQTKEEAEYARDALAKTLYAALFDFLVYRVNATVGAKLFIEGPDCTPVYLSPASKESWRLQQRRAFIGVLDIFGFESFIVNSFEQLCINYTNETLQHHFNSFVFKHEQMLYEKEGIVWKFIEFPDNREVLDLLENKRTGLFSLCDEQVRFPRASDSTLVGKFYEHCGNHTRFRAGPVEKGASRFIVAHYAGDVTYSVKGFLEKNNDVVRNDVGEMLRKSSSWIVHKLCNYFREDEFSVSPAGESGKTNDSTSSKSRSASYTADAPMTPVRRPSVPLMNMGGGMKRRPSRVGHRRIRTLGAEFQQQLVELMQNINRTSPHYVRCIKPNVESVSGKFNCPLVVQQLKCGGVLESVRVTRFGYAVRMSFQDFVQRYGKLAPASGFKTENYKVEQRALDIGSELAQLIQMDTSFRPYGDASKELDTMAVVGIQTGKSKMFLRRNAFDFLETMNLRSVRQNIVKLQSIARMHIVLRQWKKIKAAIITIQCGVRCGLAAVAVHMLRVNRASRRLQRVYRGHKARCQIFILLESILKIQGTLRRCIARKRVRKLKAVIKAQSCLRGYLARIAFVNKIAEFRSLQNVIGQRDDLKKRVKELEDRLENDPSSSPTREILPINVIEDIRENNYQDRITALECEVEELHLNLQKVIRRAAVCLDVHDERAKTLLLKDSDKEFELFRKGVSSPKKASRDISYHPQPSPPPSAQKYQSSVPTEIDENDVGYETDTNSLPTLPDYKPSNDPGRGKYLRIMSDLLLDAVQRGEVEKARYIVSSCPKIITMKDKEHSRTILHIVCEQQLVEFVDLFLQYNPNLNAQTDDGKSYLHLISDPKIVNMLCLEGADPNLLDQSGQTPLHVYVAHKLYDCVRAICSKGADPNVEDWRSRKSPLQSSAGMGDYRLLQIILSESTIYPKIDKPDFDGNTLLHLVCMTEAPGSQVHKCIMLLLDRGASPKAVNIRGITPLHFIAGNQYIWHSSDSSREEVLQLVQLLLTLSVDVNAKDSDGCTALVVACAHRKFELCQTLLAYNADMNIPCAMNSYLLRRGNHSEEEHQVDGLDCTASDLFPPGRRRSEIFAYISCRQTPVDLESRNRCMNCADSLSSNFFSRSKHNCGMCGRVICEDCVSRTHIIEAKRAPSFIKSYEDDDKIRVCIVCGPIIAENYGIALAESRERSGSKGFLSWGS